MQKTGIGFFDQGLLSAFNFALGTILIRTVSKTQYGLYVLAASIILLVVGFQNALITTQFTVLAPAKAADEQDRFCAALNIGQFIYWIPLAVLFILALYLLRACGALGSEYLPLLTICAVSALGVLSREFLRAYYYFKLEPSLVLFIDIAYILLFSSAFGACLFFDVPNAHLYALAGMGMAGFIASVKGMRSLKAKLPSISKETLLAPLKECWKNGKWALLGVAVTWLQTQSYVYLTLSMLGAEHTAVAHAARLLLMPTMLLNLSYGMLFRAKWAQDLSGGAAESVFKDASRVLAALVSIIALYSVGLYIFSDSIIATVFKEKYQNISSYIFLWAILFIFQAARSNASLILQVFQNFKGITVINAVTAPVTVILGIVLIKTIGAQGSVMAMAAGEALLGLMLYAKVVECRKSTYQSA